MPEVALDFKKTRDRLSSIEATIRDGSRASDQMWLDAFNALLSDLARDRLANPTKNAPTDLQRQSQLTSDLKKIARNPEP